MDRALLNVIVLAAIAIAATFVFVPYFPQPSAYHQFADTRAIAGIPNGWNVLSNLPFLIVGVLSLVTVAPQRGVGRLRHRTRAHGLRLRHLPLVAQ
jgi:hypothetical protein